MFALWFAFGAICFVVVYRLYYHELKRLGWAPTFLTRIYGSMPPGSTDCLESSTGLVTKYLGQISYTIYCHDYEATEVVTARPSNLNPQCIIAKRLKLPGVTVSTMGTLQWKYEPVQSFGSDGGPDTVGYHWLVYNGGDGRNGNEAVGLTNVKFDTTVEGYGRFESGANSIVFVKCTITNRKVLIANANISTDASLITNMKDNFWDRDELYIIYCSISKQASKEAHDKLLTIAIAEGVMFADVGVSNEHVIVSGASAIEVKAHSDSINTVTKHGIRVDYFPIMTNYNLGAKHPDDFVKSILNSKKLTN